MGLLGPSQKKKAGLLSITSDLQRAKEAIAKIESGGNYNAIGNPTKKGQRAYGKYQVMDFNIPSWTKEALGRAYTPEQFLKDPNAQERVFEYKFEQYAKDYGGYENAAKVWFGGAGALSNPTAQDVNGKTIEQYAADFTETFGNAKSTPMVMPKGAPTTGQVLSLPDYVSGFAASLPSRALAGLLNKAQPKAETFSEMTTSALGSFGKAAPYLGFVASAIGDPLNFFGGGAAKLPKLLARAPDVPSVIKVMKGAGYADDVAERYAAIFAPLKDEKQITNILSRIERPVSFKNIANGDIPAPQAKTGAWPTTSSKQSTGGNTSTGNAPTERGDVSAPKADTSGPFEGTVYRGGEKGVSFSTNPRGAYAEEGWFAVTPDKKTAKAYGSSVVEGKLSPDAKVKDFDDYMLDINKLKQAEKDGYDAAKFINKDDEVEIVVFNKNAVQSSPSIPKELEPLAAVARGYSSFEDFQFEILDRRRGELQDQLAKLDPKKDAEEFAKVAKQITDIPLGQEARNFFNRVKGGTPKGEPPFRSNERGLIRNPFARREPPEEALPPQSEPEAVSSPKSNTRSFTEAAKTSPDFSPDTQKLIKSQFYDPLANKDVAEIAKERVAQDPEGLTASIMGFKGEPNAQLVADATELARYYDAKGKGSTAAEVLEAAAEKLTTAGQTVQAAKLLQRLSPEGVLYTATKIVREINETLTKKGKEGVKITDAFAKKLTDLAKDRQATTDPILKEELGWEIGAMLASLKQSTIGEKVSMAQTILQLLNPKTLLTRNPLGNELFYRTERLNKYIATPIDWTRSTLTGKDRAISFRRGGVQGNYWQSFIRGARAGWKGVVPNALPTQLDIGRQVFKSKKNPFYWGEKLLGTALRGFDFAAYNRAKAQTLGELGYLKAINEGKRGKEAVAAAKKYIEEADDAILQIADDYGKYVTFQDDNNISVGLSKLKKGLNVGANFGLGDLVLKYPRTPGALLMRGIEYSPAGFLRSAYLIAQPHVVGKAVDTREVQLALSRAITGTLGFTGMGYYLADKGIITGKRDDDRELDALEKQAGGGQYRINLSALKRWVTSGFKDVETQEGDTFYSYDWAQPIAVGVSMGANINDQLDDGKLEAAGIATTFLESVKGGVDTLTEQPLVSGLTRLFGYADVLGGLSTTAQGALSSFTPTLSNQIRQWADNTKRNTYSPSWIAQAINLAKNKIPYFAQSLPPMVDQFGKNAEIFQGNSNNIFNVFFNPGFKTNYITTPESQLVFDVIEATGDKSVVPRIAAKEVDDKPLSPEEYMDLQRYIGENTREAFGAFVQSEAFMDLPDQDKADLMAQTLTEIGKDAKAELFQVGDKPSITFKDRLKYLEVKYLERQGESEKAMEIVNGLSEEEYERYVSVRSGARAKTTSKMRELLKKNPADAVLFVRSQLPAEQERLVNLLTDEEYALYEAGKE